MHDQDRLEAYLEICQRQYQQLLREGLWPWAEDSTDAEDMVDSDNNLKNP